MSSSDSWKELWLETVNSPSFIITVFYDFIRRGLSLMFSLSLQANEFSVWLSVSSTSPTVGVWSREGSDDCSWLSCSYSSKMGSFSENDGLLTATDGSFSRMTGSSSSGDGSFNLKDGSFSWTDAWFAYLFGFSELGGILLFCLGTSRKLV